MRSSINVPMNMMGQMNNMNFGGSNRNQSSFFFEEVRQQQPSVSKGVDSQVMTEVSTDVKNLVHFNNFGCGTAIATVEKEVTMQVDTNEMGS